PEQRERYRTSLLKALKPGGHLIMATFSPEAPPKCSGLPVRRYDVELLQNTLGAEFRPMRHQKELHVTPSGVEQMYLYCLFRRNCSSPGGADRGPPRPRKNASTSARSRVHGIGGRAAMNLPP